MRPLTFLASTLRVQLAQSPALASLGGAGLALGLLCVAAALVRGIEIPPEGNLIDTGSFDAALGFLVLTLVLLASGVPWTSRGRRRWAGWLIGLTAFAYVVETVQAFRGLDPRFSSVAGPVDQLVGGVFFLTALGVLVCFSIVGVKYFRAPATPLSVAVRYGAAASWVAFGVGIWMSFVTRGRFVPEAGNLLVVHAVGFHGIQAIPLVALLSEWAGAANSVAFRRVHAAGIAWFTACATLAWQSATGRAVADPSLAIGIAALSLLVVAAVGAAAAVTWWRAFPAEA